LSISKNRIGTAQREVSYLCLTALNQ